MPEGGRQRILVTGGAGFVGANLVRLLLERGFGVVVLDSLIAGRAEYLDGLDLELIEGDILDAAAAERAAAGCDGIVHLAAQTGVPGSLEDPRRDCEVNISGTLNLLEAARAGSGDGREVRFVLASSNAPLGRQEAPATEDKAPLPISPYGASKLAGEGYCLAYHGSWGLPAVALRFANLYGPFSVHKNSVVAKFTRDMLAGNEITVDGDGGQTRDFIYVEDLCRAILLALDAPVGGEVIQIATGQETSVLELVGLMREVIDTDVGVLHGPQRQGDIRHSFSRISKAERVLGWKPETDLRTGLGRTVEWFRTQKTGGAEASAASVAPVLRGV